MGTRSGRERQEDLRVAYGDRLYLYTDGLIESSPGGGRGEGLERLVERCVAHRTDSLENATNGIAADIQAEAGSIQDDLLLLGIEVRA